MRHLHCKVWIPSQDPAWLTVFQTHTQSCDDLGDPRSYISVDIQPRVVVFANLKFADTHVGWFLDGVALLYAHTFRDP
jgi:hypothetical protein